MYSNNTFSKIKNCLFNYGFVIKMNTLCTDIKGLLHHLIWNCG